MGDEMAESYGRRDTVPPEMVIGVGRPATLLRAFEFGSDLPADPLLEAVAVSCRMNGQRLVRLGGAASEPGDEHRLCEGPRRIVRRRRRRRPADQPSGRVARSDRGGRWSPAVPSGEQGCSAPLALQIHRQHGFGLVLGLHHGSRVYRGAREDPPIAPALHGAQMQSTEGSYPVVVWALVENDDGRDDVIGLAVGGKGDRALIPPDPGTFETYRQSG